MTFRTSLNHGEFVNQPCGCVKRRVYKTTTDDRGCKHLFLFEEHDIQPEINSYLSDTLVSNVLARAAKGDTSGLRKTPGEYFDCSNYQYKSFSDLHYEASQADRLFDLLPGDLRNGCESASEFFDKTNAATLSSLFTAYSDKLRKSSTKEESSNV